MPTSALTTLRSDLSALIHQADALSRRLRALATTLPAEDRGLPPIETDPATDRLLSDAGRQMILVPCARPRQIGVL